MALRHGRTGLFGRRRGLLRRLGWLSIASALWNNRRDVKRWLDFGRRAVQERDRRPMADLVTEAKVRAAVSRDPLLRRDDALEDLRVENGVVTMLTNTAGWPDPRDQMVRLKQVKGITDVTTRPVPADAAAGGTRPLRAAFSRSGRSTTTGTTGSTGSTGTPSSVTYVVGADAPIGATPSYSTTGGR